MIMKRTVLITGASTGIGKSTAEHFARNGWNVAATMRNPDQHQEMSLLENMYLYPLDVTNETMIHTTINQVMKDFGSIDVVVNNAGYGAVGIFEKATTSEIEQQFKTNVYGVMNVIREILPHYRNKGGGTIVNITSMGGRLTFPLYSVYHATKWALEGFSESLQYELRQFNIRIKNIEPGAIKTDFYTRSKQLFVNTSITDYDQYEQMVLDNTKMAEAKAPGPEVVARKIFKVVNSTSTRLRYPVGGLGPLLIFIRKILPLGWFVRMVRWSTERGRK